MYICNTVHKTNRALGQTEFIYPVIKRSTNKNELDYVCCQSKTEQGEGIELRVIEISGDKEVEFDCLYAIPHVKITIVSKTNLATNFNISSGT